MFLDPLERLKLEYIVRGEKKKLYDLIKSIATTQGWRGFWKGNFLNILRTAPFKAINFCAYDTYRKQLLKLFGNEETTNSERFLAGAAAGITATILCLPLDTGCAHAQIRTSGEGGKKRKKEAQKFRLMHLLVVTLYTWRTGVLKTILI